MLPRILGQFLLPEIYSAVCRAEVSSRAENLHVIDSLQYPSQSWRNLAHPDFCTCFFVSGIAFFWYLKYGGEKIKTKEGCATAELLSTDAG